MHNAKGCIDQIYLDGRHAAHITCPPPLVPGPGQYLLATADSQPEAPLGRPLFCSAVSPSGFYAAPPLPGSWLPGAELDLRGPFGRGFNLPSSARRVAFASFSPNCARALALLEPALRQNAAVVLLSDNPPADLPVRLEISPMTALADVAGWADYLAIEIQRELLQSLLAPIAGILNLGYAQVLIETPVPCAGVALCGVCAVKVRGGYELACKDGPVFDLARLDLRG